MFWNAPCGSSWNAGNMMCDVRLSANALAVVISVLPIADSLADVPVVMP